MYRRLSRVPYITPLALMLMASACSTVPQMPPMAPRIPSQLTVDPPPLPLVPRAPDGSMTGAQSLTGVLGLYDVAGAIRSQLVALIAAVRASEQTKEGKEHE